jgi:serine/threonine protein kinase
MSLETGSRLGGYVIDGVVGRGGMGVVYRATEVTLDRPVALKLIAPELANDDGFHERFLRESRLAASLDHPGILPLYAAGEADGQLYIATRFVDGVDLRTLLVRSGPLPAERALNLAEQVADALDAAHARKLVHRDVKPGNVLIAPDGTAKLTDFGIAQPEGATRLTSTGVVVGTRSYIAPEVERGEPATTRSDLYSCAMVLREAIGDPLPPDLVDLVSRLGDQDPGRRPESASRALALLAQPSASAGSEATTATEPLAPDHTAPTIPIGARPHRPRRTRVLIGPRTLAGVTLLAALIVLGVVLLSGGGDGSSTGGRGAGDTTGGTARQQAPATSTERPTGHEEPAPAEPPKASGKPKKEKPSKTPPGKAKGLSKP